jgi:NADH-quinone oxidoreductase subunit C
VNLPMTPAQIVEILEQKFGEKIRVKKLDAIDPFVVVAPSDLLEVCRFLRDDARLRFDMLNCVSGVDYLELDHLQSFAHAHRFVLKVILPRWKDDRPGEIPEVPSVTPLWRAADWHEREVYDLSGIWFAGHPNLTRILLAEDWVGHPLRKDYEFPLEYHGTRGR